MVKTKQNVSAKRISKVKSTEAVRKLTWQGALRLMQNRVFKIRSPHGHGTGFHIGNFGKKGELCAVATANHVIQAANDWGEPIKLIHADSGKEILLKEKDRAILTYEKDLAVIMFISPEDLKLPAQSIDILSKNEHLVPGVDIAWCGFPAMMKDQLCFFHGYVSCFLEKKDDYLIDGVAINGVSGGPAFFVDDKTNLPKIAGVITAYIVNRSNGESLPGVSMITSIAPFEKTIKDLQNLDQARKEAEGQNVQIKTTSL